MGAMPKNSNQNNGIEYGPDTGELETKGRDRISARCWRTRKKKRKGSNLGAIPENSNKNKGIESKRDAREPKIKGRDQIWVQCQRT